MTLQLSFFFGDRLFDRPRPVRGPANNAGGNDVADPPGSRPQRQKASKGADEPWGADNTARGQQEFHRSHPAGTRWREVCSRRLASEPSLALSSHASVMSRLASSFGFPKFTG